VSDLAALLLVPIAFGLSVIGPGLWAARRTDWEPCEKATATVVLSTILVGLLSFVIGVLKLHTALRFLLLAGCAALSVAGAIPGLAALRRPGTRRAALAFAFLTAWVVVLHVLIRSYSGGNIYADWLEQYERSRFFLGWQPTSTRFIADLLPSRPPLLNAFAAQIMAVTRPRFPSFQVTMTLFGGLAFLPALQIARLFSLRPAVPLLVASFLMCNPVFVQNATYPWTKLQTAFFVLAAVAFYVSGWRRVDPRRSIFAFVCGAGALLTHYSSAPIILFLALHYVLRVLPRRERPFRELAAVALVSYGVLAPWFAWAISTYRLGQVVSTAAASTGVESPAPSERLVTIVLNMRDTLVPPLLRAVPRDERRPLLSWGGARDATVTLYQRNLLLGFGALGALLLAAEFLLNRSTRPPLPRGEPGFWIGLAAFTFVVGIAVYNSRDPRGIAFSAQQPLILIGLAFLAACFGDWPRWLRSLALAGLLIDVFAGVLLQIWMQSFVPEQPDGWRGPFGLVPEDLLMQGADWDWMLKRDQGISFVSDVIGAPAWVLGLRVMLLLAALLVVLVRATAAGGPNADSLPR
jgi:hypothetical protein